MSTHCNRAPGCGCGPDIGTKCHLPDGHPLLGANEYYADFSNDQMEIISREMKNEMNKYVKKTENQFQFPAFLLANSSDEDFKILSIYKNVVWIGDDDNINIINKRANELKINHSIFVAPTPTFNEKILLPEAKLAESIKYEPQGVPGQRKIRKQSNYTPPKKRRK